MKRKLLAFTTSLLMMASAFMTSFAAGVTPTEIPDADAGSCTVLEETDEHNHEHDVCSKSEETVKSLTVKTYNASPAEASAMTVEVDKLTVVAASSHTCMYVIKVTEISPTCTSSGYTIYKCPICQRTTRKNYTTPKGHTCKSSNVLPTCTSPGYTLVECTRSGCSFSTRTNYTSVPGHLCKVKTVAPTCTAQGYTEVTCERPGCKYYYKSFRPALGHDYKTDEIDATCTTKGYTEKSCQRLGCTESHKSDYTPEKGHLIRNEVIQPTCTTGGYTRVWCDRPGCGLQEERISHLDKKALGHDFSVQLARIKEPTYDRTGLAIMKCSRCSATSQVDIPKLKHDWNDFVVTVAPTASRTGLKVRTCKSCDKSESEVLDKVPEHLYEYTLAPADENCKYGYVVFNGKYYPIRPVDYSFDEYISPPTTLVATYEEEIREFDWASFIAGLTVDDGAEKILNKFNSERGEGASRVAGGVLVAFVGIPQQVASNISYTKKEISIIEYGKETGYANIRIGSSKYNSFIQKYGIGEKISMYDEMLRRSESMFALCMSRHFIDIGVEDFAEVVNEVYGKTMIRIDSSETYDLVFVLDRRRMSDGYSTTQYVDGNGNIVSKPIAFSGDRLYIAKRDGFLNFSYHCVLNITELTNPHSDKFCVSVGF